MARLLRIFAAFYVAFLVAAAVIRIVVPPAADHVWHPTYTAKLEHLQTTDEHYDIVFVGNSRAYLSVDPSIVEETMSAGGCDVTVYNLGSVAQSKFEFDHMVRSLADIPGGTPEYVVSLDRSLFEIGLVRDFAARHRAFMSVGHFADALDYIRTLPDDTGRKSDLKAVDLTLGFAVNQVPVGAISQELFPPTSLEDEEALVEQWQGYKPWAVIEAERGEDEIQGLRDTVSADIAAGLWDHRWSPKEPDQERLDRWMSTIEAHVEHSPAGARAVHVLIPSDFDAATAERITQEWHDTGHTVPLINLVDQDLVGDFTDPGFWSDRWHVNEYGAGRVSAELGREMCRLMQADAEAAADPAETESGA